MSRRQASSSASWYRCRWVLVSSGPVSSRMRPGRPGRLPRSGGHVAVEPTGAAQGGLEPQLPVLEPAIPVVGFGEAAAHLLRPPGDVREFGPAQQEADAAAVVTRVCHRSQVRGDPWPSSSYPAAASNTDKAAARGLCGLAVGVVLRATPLVARRCSGGLCNIGWWQAGLTAPRQGAQDTSANQPGTTRNGVPLNREMR